MTNIRHLVPISLSFALLCGSFVQAEEISAPAMTDSSASEVMEETAPTMVDVPSLMEDTGVFDPGLALGRRLRIARRDCAPLRRESVAKWNACRKKNIDMRSDVLKMRREIRERSTQDFVKERAEGSQKRVKPLRKNFVEFNKSFRNYYVEPTPVYDLLHERVKTRRQNWQELRQQAGDVDARSRMLERKAQSMGSDNEDLEE